MALLNCILTAVKIVLMTINDCIGGPLSACDCLGAEALVVTINPECDGNLNTTQWRKWEYPETPETSDGDSVQILELECAEGI